MRKVIITCLILSFTSVSSFSNEESLKILSYETNPIAVLDENNRLISKIDVKQLPKPEVLVLAVNEVLDLIMIQDLNGNEIWLDTFDVRLNRGKAVNLDCYRLMSATPKDTQEAGTMGFGGKCHK
ncbi:MAG: hypothetical protein PHE38_13595 [Alishewanella agri]|nr:hypothetical protein [Alishewanella agri]